MCSRNQFLLLFLIISPIDPAMFHNLSETFGEIKQSQNSHFEATGEKNSGVVSSNRNIFLNCTNCVLNLLDNSNFKIKSNNSTLNLSSSGNNDINGARNTLVGIRNQNLDFAGDNNNCTMTGNTNVKYDSDQSKVLLEGNTNVKISGTGNIVTAKDNLNLKVLGDNNKIRVEGTENHTLSRGNNSFKVQVEGQDEEAPSWFGSLIQGRGRGCRKSSSISYAVSYEEEAKILKDNYAIGNFSFIKRNGEGFVDVEIQESNKLDLGSFQVTPIGNMLQEVVISATKEGVEQQLILAGPIVSRMVQGKKNVVRINLSPNAGL